MKRNTFFIILFLNLLNVLAQHPLDAYEQYSLGMSLYDEGKYEEALFWIEQAADQGYL